MASTATVFPIDPAAEAGRLADLFEALSDAADNLAVNAPDGTPADQLANLKSQAQKLEDVSHEFIANAIAATLQSIQSNLDQIKATTEQAKDQLGVLNDVSKAISIATAALDLGTAIVSGNISGIASAADGLAQAVAG